MNDYSPDYLVFATGLLAALLLVLSNDILLYKAKVQRGQLILLEMQLGAGILLALYGFLNYDLVIGMGQLAIHVITIIVLVRQKLFGRLGMVIRLASFHIPIFIVSGFVFTSTLHYRLFLPEIHEQFLALGICAQCLFVAKRLTPFMPSGKNVDFGLLLILAPLLMLVYAIYRVDIIVFSINSYLLIGTIHKYWMKKLSMTMNSKMKSFDKQR
jgi:hypothetical protein